MSEPNSTEHIDLDEFKIDKFPDSASIVVVGKPGSGKSTFMKNVMYYNKHKYPVARAFIGNEDGYREYCEVLPPLFVSNYYDEDEEHEYIRRQKTMVMNNGEGNPANRSINILDDINDDPSVLKSKLVTGLFKIGSRHWDHLTLVGVHYIVDLPAKLRNAPSYLVIFREENEDYLKKLYTVCGSIVGSYHNFQKLMNEVTGDHRCLIFDLRSDSPDIKKRVFWYQTKPIKTKWKFGCKEYREWNRNRYNRDYVEDVV